MTGLAEGVSYLLLLLIAMPLKYMFGIPSAVTVIGWVHGFLFVAFGIICLVALRKLRWPVTELVRAFIASIVPLGTFFLDRRWKQKAIELALNSR